MGRIAATVQVNCSRGSPRFTLQLDLDRFSHRILHSHFTSGRLYEPEVSAFLVRALRPGDAFVDIGAHIGYFSLLAATLVGEAGAVFAFEPEPGNFAELVRNAQENSFAQIRAFNLALAGEAGDVTFFFNADNDGGHALWDVAQHPFNERTRAQRCAAPLRAASLDTFDPGGRAVRAIKIDTEGAEQEVLRGAAGWLREHRVEFIICEINSFGLRQMRSSQMALRSYAGNFGYATFTLDGEGYRPRLVPPERRISAQMREEDEVFSVLLSTLDAVRSLFPGAEL